MHSATRTGRDILSRAALAIAVGACLTAAAPAGAGVVYTFTQSAPTVTTGGYASGPGPVPGVVTTGSFTLDDRLAGASYALYASNRANPATTNSSGLDAIGFSTTGPAPRLLTADLADFTTPAASNNGFDYTISLIGIAGSLIPTGEIRYNNTESDTRLLIDPDLDQDGVTTVRGTFNTDAGGACGLTGACSFFGILAASVPGSPGLHAPVSVPEPASAALLLTGLLALGAIRRR